MTGLVVDASVALAWCFPDERAGSAQELLERLAGVEIFVPALWAVEIANAVVIANRRGRIEVGDIAAILKNLGSLRLREVDCGLARGLSAVAPIAIRHGLSAYDATYLDVALRFELPLATLDRRLRSAAEAAGVELVV